MNTSEITNNLIDKIVAMYVPDGNPENWLKKIIALKNPISEYEIGEKLTFKIMGCTIEGNFIEMFDDDIINIEVTYNDYDDNKLTTYIHKLYLIK
jgi:hypothetical protein